MHTDLIELRAASAADATAVAALLAELDHPMDADAVGPRLDGVRAEGGDALLAVSPTGRALGFITFTAHAVVHAPGPVAMITALVVTGEVRGLGVGRRLVEAAKAWAAARGCVRLIVTSAEHRADAHAFYPACGLAYTGRRFATAVAPASSGHRADGSKR